MDGGGGDDYTTKYDTNHTFLEGHITHVFKVCFKDPSLVVSDEQERYLSNANDILGLNDIGMTKIEEADSRIILQASYPKLLKQLRI